MRQRLHQLRQRIDSLRQARFLAVLANITPDDPQRFNKGFFTVVILLVGFFNKALFGMADSHRN